jgi:hypothetical protein
VTGVIGPVRWAAEGGAVRLATRLVNSRLNGMLTAVALLACTSVIWRTSSAAFTGTTSNPGNRWQAGTVTLNDDDGGGTDPLAGTTMFSTSTGQGTLKPGDTGTHCITVTYNGSLTSPSAVKLYATGLTDGGLAQYLDLTIEQDTNGVGSYANCSTFAGT